MTAEVIPLRPDLLTGTMVPINERLTLTELVLNKVDALAARSPIVVRRRSRIERAEIAAFNLGRECERYKRR